MKKLVLRIVSIAAAFLLGVLGMGYYLMAGNTDSTAHMASATLPLIYLEQGGRSFNLMHGYTKSMDASSIRDAVLPLPEDREISLRIESPDTAVQDIHYEVRSLDMDRLIEDGELEFTREGDTIRADFQLMDLLEDGGEYLLALRLSLEQGREAYYYTHIANVGGTHLDECLELVDTIHGALFDKDNTVSIAQYMETDSSADNDTLDYVSIHSRYNQMIWANMEVEPPEGEVRTYITEIENAVASIRLEYELDYTNEEEETERYEVTESFRVRYTEQRMYLLNYERTAEQIFPETSDSFAGGNIELGIAGTDVDMKESDGGTVLAFSQAGSLYSYNGADTSLARLFSFYDPGKDDARTLNGQHGFRILHVDETGNVLFLVHGYMSRGRHEGRCGIQVCYYSSTLNVMEELAFLPYTKSPELLEAEMENLSFANGKNDLYLMLDGCIYRVGLEDQGSEIVAQGLDEDGYRVSEDGSMLVWEEAGQTGFARTLELMNLNTGESETIEAGTGNFIRPLGFMGEDLIYGVARQEDVGEDELGYTVFPMYRVEIRDFAGAVYKTWQQDGYYVTGCTIEGNQINLERVSAGADGFAQAGAEQILYSDEMAEKHNNVETSSTQELETIVSISLRSQADSKKVKILTPGEVLFEGSREAVLEKVEHPERYYVYGKNGVVDILSSPAKAAALAYENLGTAAAEDGSYIMKRDRLHMSNQIMAIEAESAQEAKSSLAVCLDAIFRFEGVMRDSQHLLDQGMEVLDILQQGLEDRRILDLRGCSLDVVLYYPDREIPVLAVQNDGSAVLITGFNEQNVVIMNPVTGTLSKMGMNDAREWFEENGNRFIAYW